MEEEGGVLAAVLPLWLQKVLKVLRADTCQRKQIEIRRQDAQMKLLAPEEDCHFIMQNDSSIPQHVLHHYLETLK